MAVILDTSVIPPADRIEAVGAVFAEATVPHTIEHEVPAAEIYARLDYTTVGAAAFFRHESSGIRHTRTFRQLRIAAPERVALIVHHGGPGGYDQNGYELELRDRHCYLADLTMPYSLVRSGNGAATVFQADYDQLGLPVETVRGAAARLPASPLYDLVRGHIPQLYKRLGDLTEPVGLISATQATIELVRGLIATASADHRFERAALDQTLRSRVVAYINQHLTEPDLSPERIASENNMSVRHLHKIWQGSHLSLTQWIIAQRLAVAKHELSQWPPRKTIAAVCHGCGFTDTTHFSRRFRAAYGLSPREWRRWSGEQANAAP